MTKERTDDTPETPDRPSVLALAKKLDAAIRDVDAKRAAAEAAKTALDTANTEYTDALATLTALHQQFDALMKDVLSLGGTAHVAS